MENNLNLDLNFSGDQIEYLLENIDKLPLFLSETEIKNLIETLRSDLAKIDDVVKKLQDLETDKK